MTIRQAQEAGLFDCATYTYVLFRVYISTSGTIFGTVTWFETIDVVLMLHVVL